MAQGGRQEADRPKPRGAARPRAPSRTKVITLARSREMGAREGRQGPAPRNQHPGATMRIEPRWRSLAKVERSEGGARRSSEIIPAEGHPQGDPSIGFLDSRDGQIENQQQASDEESGKSRDATRVLGPPAAATSSRRARKSVSTRRPTQGRGKQRQRA